MTVKLEDNTFTTHSYITWLCSYLVTIDNVLTSLFSFFSLLCILSHGSKLHREVQPCNWKYGNVQILLNRATWFMARLNLVIESMAWFKWFWTVPRGSWQWFNLVFENMARFKYVQDGLAHSKKSIVPQLNIFWFLRIARRSSKWRWRLV